MMIIALFIQFFVFLEGGGGPVGGGGVAEYANLPQQQLIYPSSGRGSSVPLTAGMGSSSGQQHHQFRRGASNSSWSDYRADNSDKLSPQQQFVQQQQLNSVHPRSNPSLAKVRSSSYDHGDYYQDEYNRGQRSDSGQRLGGGGSSVERSLPARPQQQQHLRHQRHPTHHHHRQHQSSSEEELRSTSECTSCEDVEVESESVSEKGKLTLPSLSMIEHFLFGTHRSDVSE